MSKLKRLVEELIIEEEDYKVSREELAEILKSIRKIDNKLKYTPECYSKAFTMLRKIRFNIYKLESYLNDCNLLL